MPVVYNYGLFELDYGQHSLEPMVYLMHIALVGFSVIVPIILIATYGTLYHKLDKSRLSIVAAIALLLLFTVIQGWHLNYLVQGEGLFASKLYSTLILLTAPLFLLFVVEYIGVKTRWAFVALPCLIPLVLNALVSNAVSLALGFLLGAAYAMYCIYRLLELKSARNRYSFEVLSLVAFGILALVLAVLAMFIPIVGERVFIVIYSLLLAMSFVAVTVALHLYPDIALNLNETLQTKYAKSTLANVNEQSALDKLEKLLIDEKLSRNEGLNLNMLAEHSGLSSHQISELINTQHGYGVSQFIRRHRVEDAKTMLLAEPSASVLSVGLAVGFTSQSSFYAAFKQELGMSPGAFRKASIGTG